MISDLRMNLANFHSCFQRNCLALSMSNKSTWRSLAKFGDERTPLKSKVEVDHVFDKQLFDFFPMIFSPEQATLLLNAEWNSQTLPIETHRRKTACVMAYKKFFPNRDSHHLNDISNETKYIMVEGFYQAIRRFLVCEGVFTTEENIVRMILFFLEIFQPLDDVPGFEEYAAWCSDLICRGPYTFYYRVAMLVCDRLSAVTVLSSTPEAVTAAINATLEECCPW